ncbi:MAG: TrmH family RNA methyltransferase [Armatimonadota bacterium]
MSIQPIRVSGQKDPVMSLLRELLQERGRQKRGLFLAEGEELAARAFDYGGRVHILVLTEALIASGMAAALTARAANFGTQVFAATSGLLGKVLQTRPAPECAAVVERTVVRLPDVFSSERVLAVMVEHGENADNLGMLLRSADAAGVSGAVLAADTVDPFCRRAVRASRGAVFTVPISIAREPARVIEEARRFGLRTIATSARGDVLYTDIDFTGPTLLVFGNEHVGISEVVREMADAVVCIPMLGRVNSLNIAAAASVVLYEAVRQRIGQK